MDNGLVLDNPNFRNILDKIVLILIVVDNGLVHYPLGEYTDEKPRS